MIYRWLIEVVYPPNSGRARRWFDGHCGPAWEGCTTLDPLKAQHYTYWEEAMSDLNRLAPRPLGLGEWRALAHQFEHA